MRKCIKHGMHLLGLSIVLLCIAFFQWNICAAASTDGFSYEVLSDGTAMITECTLKGDVVVPEKIDGYTVTALKKELFYTKMFVTSVSLPATINRLGNDDYVFSYSYGLKGINVDPNNEFLCSVDGVLYSKDMTKLYNYPICKEGTSYHVPGTVKEICCTAFASARYLKKIYLDNPDTWWKGYTFWNLGNATVYYIPGGEAESRALTHIEIGHSKDTNDKYPYFKPVSEDTGEEISEVEDSDSKKNNTDSSTDNTANKKIFVYFYDVGANGSTTFYDCKEIKSGNKMGTLPKVKRKGYTFAGWYTKKKKGTKVTSNTVFTCKKYETEEIHLYTHWIKGSIPKTSIQKLSVGKRKLTVKIKKASKVSGYQIRYSISSKMKNAKYTYVTSRSKTIRNLKKGKRYYVQVRTYRLDTSKTKVFSKWSKAVRGKKVK